MAAFALLAVPADNLAAQQKPLHVPVAKVISVDCTLGKPKPPNALVKAKGQVTTGGYTNPQLVLVFDGPSDGNQHQLLLFFVDRPPPDTVVSQVITELEAELTIERIPSGMKGVRVGSATNSIEKACS